MFAGGFCIVNYNFLTVFYSKFLYSSLQRNTQLEMKELKSVVQSLVDAKFLLLNDKVIESVTCTCLLIVSTPFPSVLGT